jgi:paired amphipathic helix protein Sin3a
MSNEDKMNFKLPPGLGGPSKTIYQRIIKKVYGRERGLEIIELLHENPAQVVPIVLKRLRQKDEEWKRAQREWNKIWREVDAKNYYKALDYLGINFKSTDRKQITSRALITEAETLKREQAEQRLRSKSIPTMKPSGLSQHQFRFSLPDKALFSDVSRLIFSYLERQSGISNNDCNKIREFATKFVAEFFDVEDASPDLNKKQVVEEEDENMADDKDSQSAMSDDSEASTSGRSTSRRRQNHRGKTGSKNLLKDATRRRRNAGRTQSPEAEEKETTADEADVKAEEEEGPSDVNMEEAAAASNEQNGADKAQADIASVAKEVDKEEQVSNVAAAATAPIVEHIKISTIFGNNPFYCFLRLYQVSTLQFSYAHVILSFINLMDSWSIIVLRS